MPDRNTANRRRRNRLKVTGITNSADDFAWLCRNTNRIGIVSEYVQEYL